MSKFFTVPVSVALSPVTCVGSVASATGVSVVAMAQRGPLTNRGSHRSGGTLYSYVPFAKMPSSLQ